MWQPASTNCRKARAARATWLFFQKCRTKKLKHIHFLWMAIGFSVFFAPSRNVGCKKSSASSGPSNFWSWTSTGSRRSSLKLSVNNELSTPVRPVLSMLGCLGDWALLESRLQRLSATGFNARLGSWLLMIRKWDFNPTDLPRSWAVGKNCKPGKNVMALRNLYHVRLRSLIPNPTSDVDYSPKNSRFSRIFTSCSNGFDREPSEIVRTANFWCQSDSSRPFLGIYYFPINFSISYVYGCNGFEFMQRGSHIVESVFINNE